MEGAAAHPDETLDVLHVDMDCFFAAVEILEHPELAGRPVIVGGTGTRGVVASASYEARVFGVRSAMPTARARSLCPNAVFLQGRHSVYGAVSTRLQAVFARFTPIVEMGSLDEAFLDVSGAHSLYGSSESIAWALREAVFEGLGLRCSVGVGRTKLIAKLASEAAKPVVSEGALRPGAGVVVVQAREEQAFLLRLPVRVIPGVGAKTAERLLRYGVSTVADLAAVDRGSLTRLLGRSAGEHLHDLAHGRDPRQVVASRAVKSISHEETFAVDVATIEPLRREVVRLADAVAQRCRDAGMSYRTVTLKVRYGDFSTVTRAHSIPERSASGADTVALAQELLAGVDLSRGVRLIGVALSGLAPLAQGAAQQLALELGHAGSASARPRGVDEAIDAIRHRYGAGAVQLASAGGPGLGAARAPGEDRWGPSDVG